MIARDHMDRLIAAIKMALSSSSLLTTECSSACIRLVLEDSSHSKGIWLEDDSFTTIVEISNSHLREFI